MELSGDEKRIQALFSELVIDDQRITPRFNVLVNRAMTASVRPRRAFDLSLAWAAVVIFAIATLVWWSDARLRQPTASPLVATSSSTTNAGFLPVTSEPSEQIIATVRPSHSYRSKLSKVNRGEIFAKRLAARRQAEVLAANKKALEDAKAISKWSSPTATLLTSSTGEVLTSLPQLNENANQLKSFLPSISN